MIDPEIHMAALEHQWREADDVVRTARAELAATTATTSGASVGVLRKRIQYAERLKHNIMQRIVTLEETSLCG